MRLSELLGRDVLDASGDLVGAVVDVRLVQDGPMLGPYGAALRVSGLIVAERRHARLLGYERNVGPRLVRALTLKLTGDVRFVPWDDVADPLARPLQVDRSRSDLPHLHDLPNRIVEGTADL